MKKYKKHRDRNISPAKSRARNTLHYAVKIGRIIKSVFCEQCGLPTKAQGHHKDYSQPLDVIWLCAWCHVGLHRGRRIVA